jgi:hypothetical protein
MALRSRHSPVDAPDGGYLGNHWAARRALRADPARLDALPSAAAGFEPRHRDALIHGLLDAADVLEEALNRRVVPLGLANGAGEREAYQA